MCFSAQASFTAAAILTAAGVVAVRKVNHPSQFPFAVIPFLFAVQQLTEGIFWLAHNGNISREWAIPSTIIFLVFAQVVWPFWVPYSMLSIETHKTRRTLLTALVIAGCVFAAYAVYGLVKFPIESKVVHHHIAYKLHFPAGPIENIRAGLYLALTLLPAFISSARHMLVLAIALFVSFLVSWLMFPGHIISTWCYFAALLSIIVIYILHVQKPVQHLHNIART